MKGVLFLLTTILIVSGFSNASAAKRYKRSGSNIYVSKKYKGSTCPKPRKVINAVYF